VQGIFSPWLSKTFTPNEAAALAHLSTKHVRNELEHPILELSSAAPPRLPFCALVYFHAVRLSGLSLSVSDRARLYRLIAEGLARTPPPEVVAFSPVLSLQLGLITQDMASKLTRFEAWKATLIINPEIMAGEAVFSHSRLSVRHIGESLERGESPGALIENHPALTPQDIEFSPLFVTAYPRVGRPRVEDLAADL
jgi:uncharacterized protein (DUF433 family)